MDFVRKVKVSGARVSPRGSQLEVRTGIERAVQELPHTVMTRLVYREESPEPNWPCGRFSLPGSVRCSPLVQRLFRTIVSHSVLDETGSNFSFYYLKERVTVTDSSSSYRRTPDEKPASSQSRPGSGSEVSSQYPRGANVSYRWLRCHGARDCVDYFAMRPTGHPSKSPFVRWAGTVLFLSMVAMLCAYALGSLVS